MSIPAAPRSEIRRRVEEWLNAPIVGAGMLYARYRDARTLLQELLEELAAADAVISPPAALHDEEAS